MKNDECVMYMTTKNGSTQIYQRDAKGWKQISSRGIKRKMTAEQLLSHLLPALTEEYKNKVRVRVERRRNITNQNPPIRPRKKRKL